MKKIILIGLCILLIGCKHKVNIENLNPTIVQVNLSFAKEMTKEEWQSTCWEETMWLCQEHCRKISGLEYNDESLATYDIMQFDENNDSIINGTESKNMDYILWRDQLCMDECIEEEVYDCYK